MKINIFYQSLISTWLTLLLALPQTLDIYKWEERYLALPDTGLLSEEDVPYPLIPNPYHLSPNLDPLTLTH
jgi:hypothetical protein